PLATSSSAPSILTAPLDTPCSAWACRAQRSRLMPASTLAHEAVAQAIRTTREISTGTSSTAAIRSPVVRLGTRQASLRLSSAATAGGTAHHQLHTYWWTIRAAVSRNRNAARVSPLANSESCERHRVAVHLLTIEPTSSRTMPSSHLRRWAHSERTVTMGPAEARAEVDTLGA